MKSNYTATLVVPAFSEGRLLSKIWPEFFSALASREELSVFRIQVLFVFDGGTMETLVALEELKQRFSAQVDLLKFEKNRGKGAVLKDGAAICKTDYFAYLDADLAYGALEVSQVLLKLIEGNPCVKVTRRSREKDPLLRRILSGVAELVVWVVCGVRVKDPQAGLKGFKGELAPFFAEVVNTGFLFDSELLGILHANQVPIAEVPVWVQPSSKLKKGESSVSWKAVLRCALAVPSVFQSTLKHRLKRMA